MDDAHPVVVSWSGHSSLAPVLTVKFVMQGSIYLPGSQIKFWNISI